jgi:hypothetical protein
MISSGCIFLISGALAVYNTIITKLDSINSFVSDGKPAVYLQSKAVNKQPPHPTDMEKWAARKGLHKEPKT